MREVAAVDPLRSLAREAGSGEGEATRRLIEAVAPSVLRLARMVLGPARDDAEDVAQESLLGFVGALAGFRGECSVLHYACRITVRTAVAARKRQQEHSQQAEAYAQASFAGDDRLPAELPLAARRREIVRGLLDELPGAQAETLALRVILGCSLQEVADATGVPVNTVRSRVRLAKESLRRRIEDDPNLRELLEVAG